MDKNLIMALAVGIIVYFWLVVSMIKRKRMSLKYALLWLAIGGVLAVLLAFPDIVRGISNFLGFEVALNSILVIFIFFIIILLIVHTSIVSSQENQLRILTQEMAILKSDVETLKKKSHVA